MKIKHLFLTLSFFSQCVIAQEIQTFGKGNIKGVSVNASSNSSSSIKTLLSTGYLPNAKSSSRFLSQATLGPKITDIVAIQNQGIETWLDTQLNLPYTFNLRNYVQNMHQYAVDSSLAKNPAGGYTLANVFIDDWAFDAA